MCFFFFFSFTYFTAGFLAFKLTLFIVITPDKVKSVDWGQIETLRGSNYLTESTEQRKAGT